MAKAKTQVFPNRETFVPQNFCHLRYVTGSGFWKTDHIVMHEIIRISMFKLPYLYSIVNYVYVAIAACII